MNPKWRKILVAGLIVGIGFIHYSCQLYLVQHTQIHNVILKLFYVPIILAAFWWGLRGGILVGFTCSVIYSIDVIRFWDPQGSQNYNHGAEILLFTGLGLLLGWMVETDRRCRQARTLAEERAEKEFQRAITDPLTQAFNRRYMETLLEETWKEMKKGNGSFSLLMIDLDKFKSINDRYGHPAGDRVLQTTGQTLLSQIRDTDFLFRYGGDEFLILLPQTHSDRALQLAKRLREEMDKLTFQGPDQNPFKTDFSIGIIESSPGLRSLKEMLDKLDQSLYQAKKASDHLKFAG